MRPHDRVLDPAEDGHVVGHGDYYGVHVGEELVDEQELVWGGFTSYREGWMVLDFLGPNDGMVVQIYLRENGRNCTVKACYFLLKDGTKICERSMDVREIMGQD